MEGPSVADDGVRLAFVDPSGTVERVSLVQEVAWPRQGPDFDAVGGGRFELWFSRPAVDRFEYRLELETESGERSTILDPSNPLRAPGAFGERSVIEFPQYRPPGWTRRRRPQGTILPLELTSPTLGADQPALYWSSAGAPADEPLPLLVALDGIEFERFSALSRMLDDAVARRSVPPMRCLLLHPTDRTEQYSANPCFAEALCEELIPHAGKILPIAAERRCRVGVGASLGGLALLHAHRTRPSLFGAVFLQSSSFFHQPQQLGVASLERVERFVDLVHEAADVVVPDPIAVSLTCGTVEMNLPNNRSMARALRRQGYPARLHLRRDAHNWIAWRDAWTPHLTALLRKTWA